MSGGKRKHLDLGARRAIEEGIESGLGAREIARRIDVAPSTVTREVMANRTVVAPNRNVLRQVKLSHRRHPFPGRAVMPSAPPLLPA